MGLKLYLLAHLSTTATLLALFSWHEDNYYRTLIRKSAEMEAQEERFFYEMQQVCTGRSAFGSSHFFFPLYIFGVKPDQHCRSQRYLRGSTKVFQDKIVIASLVSEPCISIFHLTMGGNTDAWMLPRLSVPWQCWSGPLLRNMLMDL